jgi:hypothetical protein
MVRRHTGYCFFEMIVQMKKSTKVLALVLFWLAPVETLYW